MSDSDPNFPIYQMPTATKQDIVDLRNELKDHAAQDRGDFREVRTMIDENAKDTRRHIDGINAVLSEWTGSLNTLKWLFGIPAFIAAAGTVIGLIRHW